MSGVRGVRIRWWMFGFTFAFAMLSFMQRTSIAVASESIVKDLHVTQWQIGMLNAAFLTAYTLMQVPAGALGARFGARSTFMVVGLVGLCATLATPLMPALFHGASIFVMMIMTQGILGVSQSPVFPMSAALLEAWFPARQWAAVNGLQSSGMLLGGAVTPLLIVALSERFGWRGALLLTAVPVVVVFAAWVRFGRDRPQEHPAVSSGELAELGPRPDRVEPLTVSRLRMILTDRRVLLLALSYLCFNYTFYMLTYWSFSYLVQVRHFNGIESGVAGMLPWVGAAVGAIAGGYLCDRCVLRLGPRRGYRLLPLISLPFVALLLLVTTWVSTPWAAVLALAGAFASVEVNEGAYWAATMHVARQDTGAAAGVLNTGGNAGGILFQPIVAVFASSDQWAGAFVTGSVLAIVAAMLWLGVDTERQVPAPTNGAHD